MSSRPKRDTHKKGERVQARWAGSNIFFDAKILDVTSRTYKVQFDDGSISSLKYSDVKKLDKSETPPKTSKSRSRSRSSGRQTRSRSRSPSRREKATAAKKEKKSPAKEVAKKSEGTSNSNSVKKDETDSISKSSLTREKITSSKSVTVENAKTPTSTLNSFKKDLNIVLRRHEGSSDSTRLTRLTASKSENSQRLLESKFAERRNAKEADKAKYSDDDEDDDEEEEEDIAPKKTISKLWQTIYFFGTFLKMVFVPAYLLFMVFACTKKQCTVLDIPHFYSRLRDLVNATKYPIAFIFAFHLVQGILSLIPIGRKVTGFSTEVNKRAFEYRLNGILSLGLSIIVFAICAYFGVYMNWGYDKFRGIALSCVIYSYLYGIILHIYSAVKRDSTAQSKVPILGKFYNGSYVNPVLYNKLDLKTTFIRTGLIGTVYLILSILLKYFLMKGFLTYPLSLTSGMHIFFILDLFVREEKMLSTATYTSDTLGYSFILNKCFVVPISMALQCMYLFNYDARASVVPHWCLAAIIALFGFGYYIYVTSSNMKHNFRRNPFSPEFSDVTSIPTSKKKRLIASGWWGRVRHPNYLGLLIMAIAWTLPCGFTHLVPYGPLILLTIAFIIRIFRIEVECKEKYGPAWTNYTEKVRCRILPFIF